MKAIDPSTVDIPIHAIGLQKLADAWDVSVGFLRLEIARGRLVPTRLGRRIVITSDDARDYLNRGRA
jgi:hypothetical protein